MKLKNASYKERPPPPKKKVPRVMQSDENSFKIDTFREVITSEIII